MKIYIINLKRRPDRKEFMLKQLEKLNIKNYEFVDAEDAKGKDIDYYVKTNMYSKSPLFKMHPSFIACSISHVQVYEKIIESGQRAIILEDDTLLQDNFEKLLIDLKNLAKILAFSWPI